MAISGGFWVAIGGETTPEFVTLPVTVPFPINLPPWMFSGDEEAIDPPFRMVAPEVCVKFAFWKLSTPLSTSTVPVLLNVRPVIVEVPVPDDLTNVPALLKKLLAPPNKPTSPCKSYTPPTWLLSMTNILDGDSAYGGQVS